MKKSKKRSRSRPGKAFGRKRAKAFCAKRAEAGSSAGETPPEPRRGALYWWAAAAGFSLSAAAGYLVDKLLH